MSLKNLENYLNSFGKQVVKDAKSNLSKAGKGGGNLEKSIKFSVVKNGDLLDVQFSMADYGTFVDAIKEHNPQIVAFSGLLTTTLANIPDHIKAIEDAGLRKKVKLAVGGASVRKEFAVRNSIEI